MTISFTSTCPKGVEPILAEELRALGADPRESRAAVGFEGPLRLGYAACLWSRLASRVLMRLAEFPASTADELYEGVSAIAWEDHVRPDGTLAVDAVGSTPGLTHSGFAARKVKDAVVDRLRERKGLRPSVDLARPDVRLHLRLRSERATLSLDLSGDALHRRGYRTAGEQAAAPLKENLAAAILIRAGWPSIAEEGGALVDPMCGSGTLLVEGALMAADCAPGLLREHWGFSAWLGHDSAAWEELLGGAAARAEEGSAVLPPIAGFDSDARAVELARDCARRAGSLDRVAVDVRGLRELRRPENATAGLVATNPPHGVRLGTIEDLRSLYGLLGVRLVREFDGWRAAIFTSEPELARATGLRSRKRYTLFNGQTETGLYLFDISESSVRAEVRPASAGPSAGAEMLANRLRKNLRHLRKWARRESVTCFRVYDADLPEYNLAIDLYEGTGADEGRTFAHAQEYAPPASIDPDKAERRLTEAMAALPEALGVPSQDVALKVRRRQRGEAQYQRQADRGEFVEVAEGGLRFLVNLHDYLDTGLFLDHRLTRERVRDLAAGRRFLNLFAYTATASVYAAAGGASSTTSVDLSRTYLDWAGRNLELNGLRQGKDQQLVRADVLVWLAEERKRVEAGRAKPYGMVFLDPPTFSNSKRMGERTFDVQRDHPWLLEDAVALLEPDGTLFFSTNSRKFRLDPSVSAGLEVTDLTAETIPPDFSRSPRIHSCFLIRRR